VDRQITAEQSRSESRHKRNGKTRGGSRRGNNCESRMESVIRIREDEALQQTVQPQLKTQIRALCNIEYNGIHVQDPQIYR
jgi:hypothetical protein